MCICICASNPAHTHGLEVNFPFKVAQKTLIHYLRRAFRVMYTSGGVVVDFRPLFGEYLIEFSAGADFQTRCR